jgi:hypothetical protein
MKKKCYFLKDNVNARENAISLRSLTFIFYYSARRKEFHLSSNKTFFFITVNQICTGQEQISSIIITRRRKKNVPFFHSCKLINIQKNLFGFILTEKKYIYVYMKNHSFRC